VGCRWRTGSLSVKETFAGRSCCPCQLDRQRQLTKFSSSFLGIVTEGELYLEIVGCRWRTGSLSVKETFAGRSWGANTRGLVHFLYQFMSMSLPAAPANLTVKSADQGQLTLASVISQYRLRLVAGQVQFAMQSQPHTSCDTQLRSVAYYTTFTSLVSVGSIWRLL
jgi:hypothetical protein